MYGVQVSLQDARKTGAEICSTNEQYTGVTNCSTIYKTVHGWTLLSDFTMLNSYSDGRAVSAICMHTKAATLEPGGGFFISGG